MKTLNDEATKYISGGRRQARCNASGALASPLNGAGEYPFSHVVKHEIAHVSNAANATHTIEDRRQAHITTIWTSGTTIAGAFFSHILGNNNS